MKVMRTEGESQGTISKTMHVEWFSEEKFEEKKDELRESSVPFMIIRGTDHKRGRQISEILCLAGEYTPMSRQM